MSTWAIQRFANYICVSPGPSESGRANSDYVTAHSKLSRQQGFMLMSLAADVHVTQLVNEHKGIHVMLPKSALVMPA